MTDQYLILFTLRDDVEYVHDRITASLADAVKEVHNYHDEPVRVLRINLDEGTSRDVTDDAVEMLQDQYEIGDLPHPLIADWVAEMEPIWAANAEDEYRHQRAETSMLRGY